MKLRANHRITAAAHHLRRSLPSPKREDAPNGKGRPSRGFHRTTAHGIYSAAIIAAAIGVAAPAAPAHRLGDPRLNLSRSTEESSA